VQLNQWLPIHWGASGLAILAFLPENEQRAIVDGGLLTAQTERTITDPPTLHRELKKVRKRGYACSIGQRILGAVGISAPIWNSSGDVLGDVMLTTRRSRAWTAPRISRPILPSARRWRRLY
jgi:DNA-binding IclR family transcriptional regulator